MRAMRLVSVVWILVFSATTHAAMFRGYAPYENYAVGNGPYDIVVADFDGDGAKDIAVTNASQSATGDSVSILLGNGDGTFGAANTYAVGWGPFTIEGADFDGDGDIDLSIANANDRNIVVLFGNGDGTFFIHQTHPFIGASWGVIFAHTAADFDGDGDTDLAMIMLTPNIVVVLPNDGTGTFSSPQTVDTLPGFPVDLEPGDFDGDGDIDIAVAYGAGLFYGDTIRVLRNDGDATFSTRRESAVSGHDLVAPPADFNGDGILDIAMNTSSNPGGFITVALGNGAGRFLAATNYSVNNPTGITTSDLDLDGDIDLVVTNYSPYNTVSVMLGAGDGTFANPEPFAVTGGPQSPAAADLNGDSLPDLVTANFTGDSISILISVGCQGDLNGDDSVDLTDLAILLSDFDCQGANCVGDVDGDGDTDLQDLAVLLSVFGAPC